MGHYMGKGPTVPHLKKQLVTKCYTGIQRWQALAKAALKLQVP